MQCMQEAEVSMRVLKTGSGDADDADDDVIENDRAVYVGREGLPRLAPLVRTL